MLANQNLFSSFNCLFCYYIPKVYLFLYEINISYIRNSFAIHKNLYTQKSCCMYPDRCSLRMSVLFHCSMSRFITSSQSINTFLTPPACFLPVCHHPRFSKRTRCFASREMGQLVNKWEKMECAKTRARGSYSLTAKQRAQTYTQ